MVVTGVKGMGGWWRASLFNEYRVSVGRDQKAPKTDCGGGCITR